MAATDVRPKITLACNECKHRNYITKKNRRNDPDRMLMNVIAAMDGASHPTAWVKACIPPAWLAPGLHVALP